MKTARFYPKPESIVDVTTVVKISKNVRNLQRGGKKENYSDI